VQAVVLQQPRLRRVERETLVVCETEHRSGGTSESRSNANSLTRVHSVLQLTRFVYPNNMICLVHQNTSEPRGQFWSV
jgi:hypothetical protein